MPKVITILYIVVLMIVTYLTYQSLKAFDYGKILFRNKTNELYFLLYIISFIIGFFFSLSITTILERIVIFVTS